MSHLWTRRVGGSLVVAAALAAAPASAVEVFVTIEPCRLFDTRTVDDAPALGNTQLTVPGIPDVRVVDATGNPHCLDIPEDATAIAGNVIVVRATAPGFLSVFPEDTGFQNTSHLNFPEFTDASHASTVNGHILPIDDEGELGLAWQTTPTSLPDDTDTAHVVIDVTGYFVELTVSTGGAFSKTDIYVNSQGGASPDQGPYTRTASCNDGNDIALSGLCHSTGTDTSYLISQNFNNYDTTATAASFTCEFESQGPNGNGQARIVCVNVPNP